MSEPSSARAAILGRIAAAQGGAKSDAECVHEQAALPREYRTLSSRSPDERLALLKHRLTDYGAGVFTAAPDQVADRLAVILAQRDATRIAVPRGFPAAWIPRAMEMLDADALSPRELDLCDGVLTRASIAIAETGTLILQSVPGQGRRAATLVPDYHLCVLVAVEVVETVPEAFLRLDATKTLPTTFISGPSATADIEMTRIQGVHGPRSLDVLLVD